MEYTIKKGRHYANFTVNRLFPFAAHSVSGWVEMHDECFTAFEDIPGWNKLTGISSWRIHNESARIVWRAKPNGIDLAAYVYTNGKRYEQTICTIEVIDASFYYSIEYKYGGWVIRINDKSAYIVANAPKGVWFKAFPYFGGQSTAPHDIKIDIT